MENYFALSTEKILSVVQPYLFTL